MKPSLHSQFSIEFESTIILLKSKTDQCWCKKWQKITKEPIKICISQRMLHVIGVKGFRSYIPSRTSVPSRTKKFQTYKEYYDNPEVLDVSAYWVFKAKRDLKKHLSSLIYRSLHHSKYHIANTSSEAQAVETQHRNKLNEACSMAQRLALSV